MNNFKGIRLMKNSEQNIIIYKNKQGTIKLDVNLQDETVWLTQEQIAQLFDKAKSTINEHIKNIFKKGELVESEVKQKFGISEFQRKRTFNKCR